MCNVFVWQEICEYIKENGFVTVEAIESKFKQTRSGALRFGNKCVKRDKEISAKRTKNNLGIKILGYYYDRNTYKQEDIRISMF